jgi:N-acetyl-gamma-glutamylphosphate reductase
MSKPRIFIDGQAGTIGLQIHQLRAHEADIGIVSISEYLRLMLGFSDAA